MSELGCFPVVKDHSNPSPGTHSEARFIQPVYSDRFEWSVTPALNSVVTSWLVAVGSCEAIRAPKHLYDLLCSSRPAAWNLCCCRISTKLKELLSDGVLTTGLQGKQPFQTVVHKNW